MIEITNKKYDSVSAILHWIVAFAVIGLIAAGKLVDVLPKRYEPLLVENHKAIGVLVFGLVLFRLAWRLTHNVPPCRLTRPLPRNWRRMRRIGRSTP